MSDTNFLGHRNIQNHRTVGPHRAWCLGCSEWCYPGDDGACSCCTRQMADEHPCPHCDGTGVARP